MRVDVPRSSGAPREARAVVSPAMDLELVDLLACPDDQGALAPSNGSVRCQRCAAEFPITDGVVRLLRAEQLTETDLAELRSRDEETVWYDSIFADYTNAVEIPATLARLGYPEGPILEVAAGSGRVTEALQNLGQPLVALDYSFEMLRQLARRCTRDNVVAVQADARSIPVRDGVMSAAVSAEVYGDFHTDDRKRVLGELYRVLVPGGRVVVSTLNYSIVFRAWKMLGNEGAREGHHLLGGDMYYLRMTPSELRREFREFFEVEEVTGVRNIPARSIAAGIRKAGFERLGDRFLDWMTKKGYKLDWAIETTPLSRLLGFLCVVKATKHA